MNILNIFTLTSSPSFAWACTITLVLAKLIASFIPAAGDLIIALAAIATAGLSLYFTLTGYAIITGAVETPFWTFVKQSVKSLVIVTFGYLITGF